MGKFFPLSDFTRIIDEYAYAHNSAGSSFPFEVLRRNTPSRPSPIKRDASRDPDNVPAKAGNQAPNDVIDLSLDSGSRSVKRSSSGMTGSANCDIVSKGRRDAAELS